MKHTSRALFGAALIMGLAAGVFPGVASRQTQQDDRVAWVSRSITRMQTIKPGMTRADLLKEFTTEGGISSGLRRTYVYRECPYFKVDVEFTPVGRPARDSEGRVTGREDVRDLIKTVSRPYLAHSIVD